MRKKLLVSFVSLALFTGCRDKPSIESVMSEDFREHGSLEGWHVSRASLERDQNGGVLLYPAQGTGFSFVGHTLSADRLKGKMLSLDGVLCCASPEAPANIWLTFYSGPTSLYTFHGVLRSSSEAGNVYSVSVPWPPEATTARVGAFNQTGEEVTLERISLSSAQLSEYPEPSPDQRAATEEFVTTLVSKSVHLEKMPPNTLSVLKEYADMLDRSPDARDSLAQFRRAIILRSGDAHSLFFDKAGAKAMVSSEVQPKFSSALGERNEFGYVYTVGTFDQSLQASSAYALKVRGALNDMVMAGAKTVVVDLRDNLGGNMWPLVCALRPLFPQEFGAFTYSDGRKENWSAMADLWSQAVGWEGGSCLGEGEQVLGANVVVLVSDRTTSSGEAVAIALRSVPGAVFVGKQTHGLTSANEAVLLTGESQLFVAASWMTDVDGRVYRKGVPVDVEWDPSSAGPLEPAKIREAIEVARKHSSN